MYQNNVTNPNYETRQTYECRRCHQTINWTPGSTRHDMLKEKCCAYCTSLITLWPRRIRRFFALTLLSPAIAVYGLCAVVTWTVGGFLEGPGRKFTGPHPEDPRKNRGLYGSDPLQETTQ